MRFAALAFLVLAASVAVASACGDGGKELTLQEYFPEVRAIVDEFHEERDEVLIDLVAREAEIDAESLNAFLPSLRKIVGAFRGLDQPMDVDPVHRQAVEALGIFLEVNSELVARLADADSDAERKELLREPSPPELDAAIGRMEAACFRLQDIAHDSDIALDLDCEFGLLQTRQFLVEGASMEPTLPSGTLVEHFGYRDATPQRGDIVVFRSPTNTDREFITRIIGVPGDVVEIDRNAELVKVNGEALDDPYIAGTTPCTSTCGPWQVPERAYFVMGDNRRNSDDSRQGWFVPEENILGRADE